MGQITYANDPAEVRVSFRYKDTLDAEVFNERLKGILFPGVYYVEDTLLTIVNDTTVTVGKFIAMLENPSVSVVDSESQLTVVKDILTKLDIRTAENLTGISYATPYIVVDFLYTQSETVVPIVKNVAFNDIDETRQLVLGKCLYRDNVGTKDELYDIDVRRSIDKSTIYEVNDWFNQFIGVVTGDYQVTINGGFLEGVEVDSLVLTYGGGGANPVIPPSGYHRYDLVYVDANDDLVYVSADNEADTGSDEYPRPTKQFLDLYDFPVCYIYVSGNLASRKITPSDIENIIPRFMRKFQVYSASLSDIVISNQNDCDAYFGSDYTGGDSEVALGYTPGLYGDGWTCFYNNGAKSVEIANKRTIFKNQFDVDGNPIPYKIYNRIIITSDSDIHTASNVKLEYYNNYSGFVCRNYTDLQIEEWNHNKLEILGTQMRYKDPYHNLYDTQYSLIKDDTIFMFSKQPEVNKKYNIDYIAKNVKEDITVEAAPGTDWDANNSEIQSLLGNFSNTEFDHVEFENAGTKYLFLVYKTTGVSDYQVGNILYSYSTTTNTYTRIGANNATLNDEPAEVSYLRVAKSADQVHILFKDGTVVRYTNMTIANLLANPDTQLYEDDVTAYDYTLTHLAFWVESNNYVYFTGKSATDDIVYVYYTGGWGYIDMDGTGGNPDTDASFVEVLDILVNGSDVLITYPETAGDERHLTLLYSSDGGTNWSKTTLDSSGNGHHGYSSKIRLSELTATGANQYYVAYNTEVFKNTITVAELDVSGTPALENKEAIIYREGAQFDWIDIKLNDRNEYPASSVDLVNVIGWNQNASMNQIVDETGNVGNYSSLKVDADRNIHIAYIDTTNTNLKYAKFDGTWHTETVIGSEAVEGHVSLVLDSKNQPHIAYYDGSYLRYATWNGSHWTDEVVETGGAICSMDLDSEDYPHIVHVNGTTFKYSFYNGIEWTTDTIESSMNVTSSSIKLGTDDVPQVAYTDDDADDLKYAKRVDGYWSLEIVDSTDDTGKECSLDLDSNDYAHISYYIVTGSNLKYAKWNGAAWVLAVVTSTDSIGRYTSIVVNDSDYPRISYQNVTNTSLSLAKWNGSTWDITEVDNDADIGYNTSIDLDEEGKVYISHYDESTDDLKIHNELSGLFITHALNYAFPKHWYHAELDLIALTNKGYIATMFNDYLFYSYYDSTEDKDYFLKLWYNFEITLDQPIPRVYLDTPDLVISDDFIENHILDINVENAPDLIFEAKHETDLSEWDTNSDPTNITRVTTGLDGSNGAAKIDIPDTTSRYLNKAITLSRDAVILNLKINVENLVMTDVDKFYFASLERSSGTPAWYILLLQITQESSVKKIRAFYYKDDGGSSVTAFYPINQTGTVTIQAVIRRAINSTSSDGIGMLYIDNVYKERLTGLDNYDVWENVTKARIRASEVDAGTSGYILFDDVRLDETGVYDSILNIANSIDSDYDLVVSEDIATDCINGDNKTFGNKIESKIVRYNKFHNNISQVNHGNIDNKIIEIGSNKNFNECYNINMVALKDKISYMGNGDYDA